MPSRRRSRKPELRNVAAILNRESSTLSHQSVPPEKIHLPKSQPRRFFDEDRLAKLVESVQEHGILEPLIVRPIDDDTYELVAGERRFRAALELSLAEVPIISRSMDDKQALQLSLVENLQREDLNPIEETDAVLDLLSLTLELEKEDIISLFYQAHHAKHRGQQLGQNVLSQLKVVEEVISGIGRFNIDSFRSSRLPLLNLPIEVLNVLREGKLEYTKCQAIARIKDKRYRNKLLKLAVNQQLSLKEIKEKIKTKQKTGEKASNQNVSKQLTKISRQLRKPEIWDDQEKKEKIQQLLDELESLVSDAQA